MGPRAPALARLRAPHRTPRRYGSGVLRTPARLVAAWLGIFLGLLFLVAAMIAGSVAAENALDSSLVGHVSTILTVAATFFAFPRLKRGAYAALGLSTENTDENPDAAPGG